jgi:hypothetical protein
VGLLGRLERLQVGVGRTVVALIGDAADGEHGDRGEHAEDHDDDEQFDEGEPSVVGGAVIMGESVHGRSRRHPDV